MKKITKILLVAVLINLLSSFAYAGMGDEPRPTSTEPITIAETTPY